MKAIVLVLWRSRRAVLFRSPGPGPLGSGRSPQSSGHWLRCSGAEDLVKSQGPCGSTRADWSDDLGTESGRVRWHPGPFIANRISRPPAPSGCRSSPIYCCSFLLRSCWNSRSSYGALSSKNEGWTCSREQANKEQEENKQSPNPPPPANHCTVSVFTRTAHCPRRDCILFCNCVLCNPSSVLLGVVLYNTTSTDLFGGDAAGSLSYVNLVSES